MEILEIWCELLDLVSIYPEWSSDNALINTIHDRQPIAPYIDLVARMAHMRRPESEAIA